MNLRSKLTATPTNSLDGLLSEFDTARILRVTVSTIRRWRLNRQGPRYIKVGASVRYRPEDLKAYLDSRPAGGEGVQAVAEMNQ